MLVFEGGNTYTGGTTVAAGTLRASNTSGSATGTGSVSVGNNTGVATLSGTGFITGAVTTSSTGGNVAHLAPGNNTSGTLNNFGGIGTLTLQGGLTIGTGGMLDFDLGTSSDLIAVSGGGLDLGSGITLNVAQASGFALGTPYTLINYTSGISNAANLSSWTYTGVPAATSATFTNTGSAITVTFNSAVALYKFFDVNGSAAGSGIVNSNTYAFSGAHFNSEADGTGTPDAFSSGQTATFSAGTDGGGQTYTVEIDTSVSTDGLNIEDGNLTLAHATGGSLTLTGANINVADGASAIISEAIGGTVGLTKVGAGVLTLRGTNTYTGTTTVNAGTLEFDNGNNSLSGFTISGGTAQINFGSQVTLTSGPALSVAAGGALLINGTLLNDSTTSLPAPSGSITVNSGGTVIQKGNGSPTNFLFSANTTFDPGSTFIFRDFTNSPSVSGRTYTSNVVFDSTGGAVSVGSVSGSGTWTVNGDLTIGSNVTFNYANANTLTTNFLGNITVDGYFGGTNGARSFTVNPGKALTVSNSGTVNMASEQTLTVASGATAQIEGTLSGAGNLTVDGEATIAGTGSFTGATTVSGTLEVSGSLTQTSQLTVESGGTLLLSGTGPSKINSEADVILAGGTLKSEVAGLNQTLGVLTLTAESVIDFAGLSQEFHFAASSNASWHDGETLFALNIYNYAEGSSHLYFGMDGDALTSTQLGQISFFSGGEDSTFLGNGVFATGGEVTYAAVPEPGTVFAGLALVGLIGYRERRRIGALVALKA